MIIVGDISQDEVKKIVERAEKEHKGEVVKIEVNGDFYDIYYEKPAVKFDRVRRITGYLVGTMDRWNDAKRSEESERVKHGIYEFE